jgi:hypothetical protein
MSVIPALPPIREKPTLIGLSRSPENAVGYAYRRPSPIVVEGLAMKLRRRNFLHLAAGVRPDCVPLLQKEALISARKISP